MCAASLVYRLAVGAGAPGPQWALAAALIYLMFCTLLTGLQKLCEKRLRVGK